MKSFILLTCSLRRTQQGRNSDKLPKSLINSFRVSYQVRLATRAACYRIEKRGNTAKGPSSQHSTPSSTPNFPTTLPSTPQPFAGLPRFSILQQAARIAKLDTNFRATTTGKKKRVRSVRTVHTSERQSLPPSIFCESKQSPSARSRAKQEKRIKPLA